MEGQQERSSSLFSSVSIEDRIPANHPLSRIRKLADQPLDLLNPTFFELYAAEGRPTVPMELLLLDSLLAGVLRDLLGAAFARAAQLQPAIPLICGAVFRINPLGQTLYINNLLPNLIAA